MTTIGRPMMGLLLTAVILTAGGIYLITDSVRDSSTPDGATVTFNRDIAPIVFRNCIVCHRPGELAPFSLLAYAEARERAGLIAALTTSRFMPPWLPARGSVEFLGERGLSDDEIALIRLWAEQGAVEGDPADLPALPVFTQGWQLGEPDLVLTMEEVFTVPAEGVDTFRNFVLPIPVSTPRWVKAVELRPGNPRVVHHAVMQVDRSRSSRRRDEEDAGPGFSGMDLAGSEAPGGQSLGWTPGKLPIVDERLAWRVEPGSDMILQLHMLPSGKPEQVAPKIGLYFTDQPPTEQAFSLLMRNDNIDIRAGDGDYVIEDSLTLPVAVEALGIYPHAHYLCKSIEAYATLPDGRKQLLINIPKWDFHWQDDYRYSQPLHLPAGTRIHVRFVYDNTSANALNPHNPPQRVRFGNRSTDEMATLTIQVIPEQAEHKPLLREKKIPTTGSRTTRSAARSRSRVAWMKRCRIYTKRYDCTRGTPSCATTSAIRCWPWASSRKPSRAINGRWPSSLIIPRPTIIWPWHFSRWAIWRAPSNTTGSTSA
jgi:hypothetical protein